MKENLEEYVGQRVKLIDIENKEFVGKVESFTQASDTDSGVDEIDIKNENNNRLYGILKTEIKSIEVLN